MLNNFLLKNSYNQVIYVNPFNQEFEQELYENFEKTHNNPVEVLNRHWEDPKPANGAYTYFRNCAIQWKSTIRTVSPREWVNIDAGTADSLKGSHIQVGLFFSSNTWVDQRRDADEEFDHSILTERFANVLKSSINVWNVTDPYGATVAVMEWDQQNRVWRTLSNIGEKPRRSYTHGLPILSFRQFKEDMHRAGIELFWKPGVAMNRPNLEYRQRHEPKLSHYVDIVDSGVVFVGQRNGTTLIRFDDENQIEIDHRAQSVSMLGIGANDAFSKHMYRHLYRVVLDLGNELNHMRDKLNLSVGADQLLNDLIFKIQRKLTIHDKPSTLQSADNIG
jgi:hypothetical protein